MKLQGNCLSSLFVSSNRFRGIVLKRLPSAFFRSGTHLKNVQNVWYREKLKCTLWGTSAFRHSHSYASFIVVCCVPKYRNKHSFNFYFVILLNYTILKVWRCGTCGFIYCSKFSDCYKVTLLGMRTSEQWFCSVCLRQFGLSFSKTQKNLTTFSVNLKVIKVDMTADTKEQYYLVESIAHENHIERQGQKKVAVNLYSLLTYKRRLNGRVMVITRTRNTSGVES